MAAKIAGFTVTVIIIIIMIIVFITRTYKTRLPSNLRPTTCKCMHLVTCGHVKDGSHTIRSAIAENPTVDANLMALFCTEAKLLPIKVLHRWNRDFCPFLLR